MKLKTRILISLILLAALLQACNLPQNTQAKPTLDAQQIGIMVSQTLQAVTTVQTRTAPDSSTPTMTQTPTLTTTPTYALPMLAVNEDTNCRSGPGLMFDVVKVVKKGATAEIVGRYPQGNYWVIKTPGKEGICWIWGETTTANGSFASLSAMTPPPTPTANPPRAPLGLRYDFTCAIGAGTTVNITWQDVAASEQGYRVYRNGVVVTQLPANATVFTDIVGVTNGTVFYKVEAFHNASSASTQLTVNITCQ